MSADRMARLREAMDAPDLSGTKYELRERLGRGGMGTVYRAHDVDLSRDVALKVLSAPDPDGALAARMRREAQILARLDHPSVVPVHDVGVLPDGRVFYVMKLVEGERLDAWAARVADVRAAARVLMRAAEAVAFAHARGVIHRDLKPANIMVGAFGEAYVMDWGVAKVDLRGPTPGGGVGDHPTESGMSSPPARLGPAAEEASKAPPVTAVGAVIGTPGFMSPEQARGDVERIDSRSDVHALGATLRAIVADPPRPMRSIIARACAIRPEERFSDATAFAVDLGAWLEGRRIAAHAETFPEALGRLARQHRVILSLIGAYLAMRVAIFVWNSRG